MHEVNFYADWEIVPDVLYLSALYGLALPDDAAQELFGNDDTMHILEASAFVYF